jgi:hypothetical protein
VKKKRIELPPGFWEDNAEHLRKLQERIGHHARKLAEEQAERAKRQS